MTCDEKRQTLYNDGMRVKAEPLFCWKPGMAWLWYEPEDARNPLLSGVVFVLNGRLVTTFLYENAPKLVEMHEKMVPDLTSPATLGWLWQMAGMPHVTINEKKGLKRSLVTLRSVTGAPLKVKNVGYNALLGYISKR